MSTDSGLERAARGIRIGLGVSGAIALVVGILILVWPGRTAEVLTAIIAIWTIVGGVVYAGIGLISRAQSGWSRVGYLLLGILFVVAGIIIFANLSAATAGFAIFLGIFVGVLWIVEGVVAFTALSSSPARGWTIFYAILSIVAGVVLVSSPWWGAAVLWLLLGISLVVLGIAQIIRAITLKV